VTISYPISLPSVRNASAVALKAMTSGYVTQSPFTFSQEVQTGLGDMMGMQVTLPPMKRQNAEAWLSALLSLKGVVGTFLMGIPGNKVPMGIGAAQSPKVKGATAALISSLNTKGWGITGNVLLPGDWIQLGSGSTAHLHKNLTLAGVGSPDEAVLDIWPPTRNALNDGDAIVVNNPQGVWRLAQNEQDWSIGEAIVYGLNFTCIEALS
jgi:hypothetical protein